MLGRDAAVCGTEYIEHEACAKDGGDGVGAAFVDLAADFFALGQEVEFGQLEGNSEVHVPSSSAGMSSADNQQVF